MTFIKPASVQNGKYRNSVPTVSGLKKGALGLIWKFFTTDRKLREPKFPPGIFLADPTAFAQPQQDIRVTWLGHSTVLLELHGRRILLDPMWGERASFVSFAGPKRFFPPPLPLAQLPKIDAIVLSHDHYDHLDASTWRALSSLPQFQDVPVFTSLAVGKHLARFGYPKQLLTELDWSNTAAIAPDITLTCLPARHFSGRSPFNRNETLWSAFAIKSPSHNIFFGADSGPFEDCFREIGERFGPFDLTMLEIGAYGEQWPDIHMGPDHALNAQQLLRGKLFMPIHWGTFNLALHPWNEPVQRILALAEAQNVPLLLPRPGVPHSATPDISYWWKNL